MLRMLGPIKKSEVKATQNLSIIVLFFILCWFPLYTINCIQAFRRDWKVDPTLMEFCIVLSHLNSAGNPLLYAYHLRDFRAALKSFLWKLLGMQEEPAAGGGGGGGGCGGGGFGAAPGARSVGSQLGLAAAALGGGPAGRAAGGGGGGAWASAVGVGAGAPSLRRSAPALHLLLAPPATPAATTAHSSMTSIASSMGSVHQAAAAPALSALPALAPPATPPPPPAPAPAAASAHHAHSAYRVEVVGGTMSTVAEASQSEEEPSTTPASAGPAPSPAPSQPPSPSHLSPVGGGGDGPLSLGLDAELSDGDDDVFVPASAPNAAAIGAAGARPSGSACEYRARHLAPARRVASAPRAKHRVLRPPSDDLGAENGDGDAAHLDFSDDRAELSPRAGKAPVITNGNGELRRASREGAPSVPAPGPAHAHAHALAHAAGAGARKLSPLKAVSDFLLGAKPHPGRRKDAAADDAAAAAAARDDVGGRDGVVPGPGPPAHRNGAAVHVAQRDA
ncbi:hypothetical protein R5R35_005846 [Gryllus longicercus]|uniref:G-protein coupled receptors family 1 profile domain-containing protein n=1 Tax=Gryllus longicercus TaxID=2509291 RepID=A0AAN9VNA2_9ORTH